jgi:hypothetical protein
MANPVFDSLGASPGNGATITATVGQTVTWTHVVTAPTAALLAWVHSDQDINVLQWTWNDFGLGAATLISGVTYAGSGVSCKVWGWMDVPAGTYTLSVTVPNSLGSLKAVLSSLSYSRVLPGANWRDTSGEGFSNTVTFSGQAVLVLQNPTGQYGDTTVAGMTYVNAGAPTEWDSGQTSQYAFNATLYRVLVSDRPGQPAMELAWAVDGTGASENWAACPVCLVGTGDPPFSLAFRGA